jgi:hypothetical protein
LPPGCHIHLQRQTQQQVLRSLRALTHHRWTRLIAELQAYVSIHNDRNPQLSQFITDQTISVHDVYRDTGQSGWSTLRRAAGLLLDAVDVNAEAAMSRRFGSLLHIDDPDQIELLRAISAENAKIRGSSAEQELRLQMLAHQVIPGTQPLPWREFLAQLQALPTCCDELRQIADFLEPRSRLPHSAGPIPGLEQFPLKLHAAYRIREILTAVGFQTERSRPAFREGVLRLGDLATEILLVTLDKSDALHARVAYHDYAISPSRFHWQTQNAAGPNTKAGRRYIESLTDGWAFQLFVRSTKEDPYRPCGPVRIQSPADITGDRPMNIEWTLDVPLPARMFSELSVLRGQG